MDVLKGDTGGQEGVILRTETFSVQYISTHPYGVNGSKGGRSTGQVLHTHLAHCRTQ